MECAINTGAMVERGRVIDTDMRVESMTRIGVVSRPLAVVPGVIVQEDDMVWFCMMDDGNGLILAKAIVA